MIDPSRQSTAEPTDELRPPGNPSPLGARYDGKGTNFSIFSRSATAIDLILFDGPEPHDAFRRVELVEREGPLWHVYVPGVGPGQLYGYRVNGPYRPDDGHRFNRNKLLLDPYTRTIGRPATWHPALYGYDIESGADDTSFSERDSAPYAPLGCVTDDTFDWDGEAEGVNAFEQSRPRIPWEETIIYETHVRGLTMRHPDVPERLRGTYPGACSGPVIEHLKRLGVTTVQFQPVHAKHSERRLVENGLVNYWGYNPLAYFAPEPTYASDPVDAVREFKTMVRTFHAVGIEVVLDVVYNHTAEGNRLGPTLSFRGIDNAAYYKEQPNGARFLVDFTGTGNTLDAGNPFVLQLIMDSLRYWVQEMHVDGFRFDLAAALARDLFEIDMLGAFFKVIQQDPVLSAVKLIAEPWDVGPGGYQVGSFPWLWTEWNGKYRDGVRQFWRGDGGTLGEFATRVAGSSDLYALSGRKPFASINFVTAHDGFTLEDLVSYERKHNEPNLENNRDGHEPNYSSNSGVEGPTDDPGILARREALKRCMTATLFLSQGVPMWLGGDELSRTQLGNNNAYCQDNDVNWYDWELDERQESFLEFVRSLIALRKNHPTFRRHRFLRGGAPESDGTDAMWWHVDGREMTHDDWHDSGLSALGMVLVGDRLRDRTPEGRLRSDLTFLLLFNTSDESRQVRLPSFGTTWTEHLTCDGSASEGGGATLDAGDVLELEGLCVVVLSAESHPGN